MTQTLYNGVQFPQLGPNLSNVATIDYGCVPMVETMMSRGLQVDLSHFAKMEKQLTEDMERITAEVEKLTGYWVNLGSGDQVSDLLHTKLGIKQPKVKLTKSGDRESVDYEALVAIQHEHEVVPNILDYKELDKLRGTYVVPMPKLAKRTAHGEWRMYPNLGQSRVPSGRFNCKEPNLLAFPTRTKRGRQIREGFITDPGWCYLSIDFSQFEPRAAAHYSGDEALIRVFTEEEDLYSDFAISAFSIPDYRHPASECDCAAKGYGKQVIKTDRWHYPLVDKEEHRFPAKTCTLASIYDVTASGLQEQMPVICVNCLKPASADKDDIEVHDCDAFAPLWVEDKCQDIINAFYFKYPGLLRDRRRHHGRARQFGYLWDEWGRLHHVAAVRSVHPWVVAGALREAGNFPYQGLNAGALKLSMAQSFDELSALHMMGDVCWPLLPIHDELVWEVREDVAEELGQYLQGVFESCVQLKVPVKAEFKTKVPTWGQAK